MNRPDRSYLDKVVRLRWRDSFQGDFEEDLGALDEDVVWTAYGLVVRETELFLTLTYGRWEGKEHKVHSPLSIPWSQIINLKVLGPA